MVATAVISQLSDANHGAVLTFIVPAHKGCNLKCSFCFISQRGEIFDKFDVDPHFYKQFIDEAVKREKISAVCIQGHEPLLPESTQFTFSILDEAHQHHIPTGLVTNGTYLANSLQDLCKRPPNKLAVSLDASDPELHDRQRGVPGAWEATVHGLRCAARDLGQWSELVVASVLMPKRRKQLEDMPILLNELGINHWVVTPLLKIGKARAGKCMGERRQMWQDLMNLKRAADRYHVEFAVEDELNILHEDVGDQKVVDINELRIQRLPNPANLFRLLPNGQCSMGQDILTEVRPNAPRWDPGREHAGDFIQRVRAC